MRNSPVSQVNQKKLDWQKEQERLRREQEAAETLAASLSEQQRKAEIRTCLEEYKTPQEKERRRDGWIKKQRTGSGIAGSTAVTKGKS